MSEIAADKTQARPMARSGGQDAAGGLARTPASALLGAEFLALENKSNLQAHRGLRSGPPGAPGAIWKAPPSQERVSESPPAAGAAVPLPHSPGSAKQVITHSQGTGVPGEVW